METTIDVLRESYEEKGFVAIENIFNNHEIALIQEKINHYAESAIVDLYRDRDGILRRMENFTFKDSFFINLNQRIIHLLSKITGQDVILFKDKVNFKPSGGEGFYPHYDGIFSFKRPGGIERKGWYEYADNFHNVLIALDNFTVENGALEISQKHVGSFEELLLNTRQNGTPDLLEEIVSTCEFIPLLVKKGGVAIFNHNCPHRSGPNYSSSSRGSLYWTYIEKKFGNLYNQYFQDKHESTNYNKALQGDRIK